MPGGPIDQMVAFMSTPRVPVKTPYVPGPAIPLDPSNAGAAMQATLFAGRRPDLLPSPTTGGASLLGG